MKKRISIQAAFELISAEKTLQSMKSAPVLHCTNPRCDFFHAKNPNDTSWRSDHGTYSTQAFGVVHRYRCRSCGIKKVLGTAVFFTQEQSVGIGAEDLVTGMAE